MPPLLPHHELLMALDGGKDGALDLYWMHTADGCNCVCLIQTVRLRAWKG